MNFPDEHHIRILGIDPGSQHCGISVLDWDPVRQVGIVQHAQTAVAAGLTRYPSFLDCTTDDKTRRLLALSQSVATVFQYYTPTIVASEAPYMGRFPQAFRVLSELTMLIRNNIAYLAPLTNFVMVDPPSVKRNMGVPAKSGDKDLMQEALLKHEGLSYAHGINPMLFDEHTVDSICVALWLAKTIS